ncbi:MAG: hypothetical protein CV087_22920 [Candidatus Brocadia sp. WS118]|nr:MAG: hypothetical protein CV087_22920 [Candidatus Brocadia sp. WS118]
MRRKMKALLGENAPSFFESPCHDRHCSAPCVKTPRFGRRFVSKGAGCVCLKPRRGGGQKIAYTCREGDENYTGGIFQRAPISIIFR